MSRPAVHTIDPCGRCFYPLQNHAVGHRYKNLLAFERKFEWAQDKVGARCADGYLSTDQVPVQSMYCGCCCCASIKPSGKTCTEHNPPPQPEQAREWEIQLLNRRGYVVGEIAYWEEHLATLQAEGKYTPPNTALYHKGDRIVTVWGNATVVRPNTKSITVILDPPQIPGEMRIDYERVLSRITN